MTTTTFTNYTTPVVADWLNDVDAHVYDQKTGAHVSSNISYTPSGTGAVATTVQTKLRESVSVKDFGAVGDGVTDDTAAIQAALDSGAPQVNYSGGFLISSSLNVPAGICLQGAGVNSVSYINKKTGMTTPAIKLNYRSAFIGGGVYSQAGTSGGGILVQNNSVIIRDCIINGNGQNGVGVYVGDVLGSTHLNCNLWNFSNVQVWGWASHGFHFHSGAKGTTTNISTRARAANIVTVVTSVPHGLTSSTYIDFTCPADSTYNVTQALVTYVDPTTFTYKQVGAAAGATADGTATFSAWVACDVNAGNAVGCFANSNGGDGFRVENAAMNTFTGCLGEANTGIGMNIAPNNNSFRNFDNMLIGGDYEGNSGGQIVFGANSVTNGYVGLAHETITNLGYRTLYGADANVEADFTPVTYFTGTTPVTTDYVTISGTSATVHTTGAHGLSVNDFVYIVSSPFNLALAGGFKVTAVDVAVTGVTFTVTIRSSELYPWTPPQNWPMGVLVYRCNTNTGVNFGRYQLDRGKCYFTLYSNITTKVGTGSLQIVLPYQTRVITNGYSTNNSVVMNLAGAFATIGGISLQIPQSGALQCPLTKGLGAGLTAGAVVDTDVNAGTAFTITGSYWA